MSRLARIPLEGGGAILPEEAGSTPEFDSPVKADRAGDAVHELPRPLQQSPVTAQAGQAQPRETGPQQVESGMNSSAGAGAAVASGGTADHLKARVVRESESPAQDTR